MTVILKEVQTKKDLKRWVDFPNKMYKNVDAYVPFLMTDEISTFTKDKNPAYKFCETKLYLAYIDNEIVGRIGALINHAANEKWGTNIIRFTRFDFVDNFEVSSALFNAVVSWGKERGFTKVMGPIGFTDIDHEGMLIDGFNELNMSITFYNHPYYITHMEKLGLVKEVDWVEHQLTVPKVHDEKFIKMSKYLQDRNGYKVVTYTKRKDLMEEAKVAFKVIDVAMSKLFGTVPLTEEIVDKAIADYISIVNLKYICSIKDKNDNLIAFAALVPSIAKALKKSNGRLLPFGIFRLLKALKFKNEKLECFFIAVDPECQKKGVPAIILNQIMKMCIENGVKFCETGPQLENNLAVQNLWRGFEAREYKHRRCWSKEI